MERAEPEGAQQDQAGCAHVRTYVGRQSGQAPRSKEFRSRNRLALARFVYLRQRKELCYLLRYSPI